MSRLCCRKVKKREKLKLEETERVNYAPAQPPDTLAERDCLLKVLAFLVSSSMTSPTTPPCYSHRGATCSYDHRLSDTSKNSPPTSRSRESALVQDQLPKCLISTEAPLFSNYKTSSYPSMVDSAGEDAMLRDTRTDCLPHGALSYHHFQWIVWLE